MGMINRWLSKAFVVVFLAVPCSASAAVLQFFGEDLGPLDANSALPNSDAARASFLANLIGVVTEDFEGAAVGATAPLGLTFGAVTATLNGAGTIRDDFPLSGGGRFPTSGTHYWSTNSSTGAFSVTLSSAQAAFGFYATDVGDFAGQLTIELVGGGSISIAVPATVNAPNASGIFFGVIATTAAETFTSVNFGTTSGDDFFGFDDLTIGSLQQVNVVPEPGTLLLLGFGALAALRRRRA